MLSFDEWLQFREIFTTTADWMDKPEITSTTYTRNFYIDDLHYSFDAQKKGALYQGKDGEKVFVEIWSVMFMNDTSTKTSHGITGDGNATTVFSSVFEILEDLIHKKNPDVIQFTAKEMSRRILYFKMVQRYAPQLGYVLYKNPVSSMSDDSSFEIVRKDKYEELSVAGSKFNDFAKSQNPIASLRALRPSGGFTPKRSTV